MATNQQDAPKPPAPAANMLDNMNPNKVFDKMSVRSDNYHNLFSGFLCWNGWLFDSNDCSYPCFH